MKKNIQLSGGLVIAWISFCLSIPEVSAMQVIDINGEEVVVEQVKSVQQEVAATATTVVTEPVVYEPNYYEVGQCTWGAKELAPWAGTYWGNGGEWADSARAAGFEVGTTPKVGAIAVWTSEYGGYGHVAVVTDIQSETNIQVMEANYFGNQTIGNHRGWFDPTTTSEGTVSYIYPKA